MAVVDFTSPSLPVLEAVPTPIEFARVQRPANGAAALRTDRLGNRWAFDYVTPPMALEPEGRVWQAKFDDAARLGGLFRVHQPGFVIGAPGNAVTVASDTASGRTVPLAGLTPYYAFRYGQWLSFIVDGQRYLDRVMAPVIAANDGTASVRLRNLLRVPLSADDIAEVASPKIEGTVEMQAPSAWTTGRTTDFRFRVTEDA